MRSTHPRIWWDGTDFLYLLPGPLLGVPGHEPGPGLYRAQAVTDIPADGTATELVHATTGGGSWDMTAPGCGGVEGFYPDHGGVDLHYTEWDSTDGNVRLWAGQHGGVDACAVTVAVHDGPNLTMRCTRAQLAEWSRSIGLMLTRIDEALEDVTRRAARDSR